MHRALVIRDILRLIFEYLAPEIDIEELFGPILIHYRGLSFLPNTRSSLRNVALVCRSFKDPALDLLWWAMDDLGPLFSLLGHEEVTRKRLSTKLIRHPLLDSEIATFFSYARRIRLCFFKGSSGSASANRTRILPSLKYLLCLGSHPELHFLMSPCLVGFHAFACEYPKDEPGPIDVWTFVRLLPQKASGFRYLRLECPVTNNCLQAIARMPNLRLLDIGNSRNEGLAIDASFLKALSFVSNLSKLHFQGRGVFLPANVPLGTQFQFENLTDMCITCTDPIEDLTAAGGILKLFHLAKFPNLQKLHLHYPGEVTALEIALWHDFFESLVQATTRALSSFSIEGRSRSASTPVTLGMVSSIFKLSLKYFDEVDFFGPITMSDCKFFFETLIQLATGLPCLRELHILLDCREIPPSEDVPILAHPLSSFSMTNSSRAPTDPFLLAVCLDRLFPFVDTWYLPVECEDNRLGVGWAQVNKLLHVFQSTRSDQKVRESIPQQSVHRPS
ncbi:hypothetical protein CPB84DRAFT_1786270 [Gymnopilus junonius]|uniref:F-box domain-containing protein n=1 Tax=Gymnopilus junonius TaxID=109634 RepID=A0A9P5NJ64_GYMJU|nr:hypothetical protein CPB84DRAFT_1786270 [Gymnopilus junonius]